MKVNLQIENEYSKDGEGKPYFTVIVDDKKKIRCRISNEALQDINPLTRNDSIEHQFKANKNAVEDIARKKIEKDEQIIIIELKDLK